MDDLRDLTVALQSRFPIVVVETHEEARVLALLERVCNLEDLPCFLWSVVDGLRRPKLNELSAETDQLPACLRHIRSARHAGVYVLLDPHPYLEDPITRRLIKEIAADHGKSARTLVLVGPQLELPAELRRLSLRFELSLPDAAAIRVLLREEAQFWTQQGGRPLGGEQEALESLVQQLAGLPLDDARRLARQAIRDDGSITRGDLRRVLQHKRDSGAGGLLEVDLAATRIEDVAGLPHLKRWLAQRREPFVGNAAGLDPPRGVLLLGVQGAGKSLAAKAVAGSWRVPLLRLDFGSLYSKWSGQTECNLRESLRAAETLAPCVLWIDEIEKGLAPDGAGSDGGVSRRILGTLLTWMAERGHRAVSTASADEGAARSAASRTRLLSQDTVSAAEREDRVFLVATANDVSALPPELLRKGRFDEIFFVDLPDAETRAAIFGIHLGRRGLKLGDYDLSALASASEGFSGAEIEQAVVSSLYEARAAKAVPSTASLTAELQRTRPLSVVMAERVEELRTWARDRTVPAG